MTQLGPFGFLVAVRSLSRFRGAGAPLFVSPGCAGGVDTTERVTLISFIAFLVSSVAMLALTVLLFCTMVFHKH